MALTLIKEDGTGKVDANCYADVADGDAYHEGHLYAGAWTAAATASKEQALVFATRLIDAEFQFNGWRAHDEQALQWPRERCQDPDKGLPVTILLVAGGAYVDSDLVPRAVIDATCEMARALLIVDRTAAAAGEGVASVATGAGATFSSTKYDKGDTRPVISHVPQAMLAKFGAPLKSGSGAVRLVRA